jgi:hypothetical protein
LSDSAARHRARQTIVNLVLALAASVALVVLIVTTLPRDESNRIKPVAYDSIVTQAASSSGLDLIKIKPLENWWCNLAQLNLSSSDAVPNFKAGFVGSNVKYLGYTQAFGGNPTWLAFQIKEKTLTGTFEYSSHTWNIYQSIVKNDPAKTMDYMMVLNYKNDDYVLLYGVADKNEYEAFAKEISDRLKKASSID